MNLQLYMRLLFLALLAFSFSPAQAYGVLTHQAVVDAAWETNLKPLLLKRYPKAT
ncbi:hypothetical protein [uncultured Pontibacter sp.]|uniref:hypothetical protein n=1 Tax=uncultured Pontibacter sp. TaxID=453356 RepID=UPI002634DBB6|nr:hypothetical protein [uncultured Pontibacter sp.]